MGSNDGYSGEKPVHNVCLSAYNIDVHEVTQGEYSQVMGNNPSYYSNCGSNCPVEQVDWNQAQDYCQKLGKRLPTEAEWEYAARGGATSRVYKYSGSNNPDDVAWYYTNSGSQTHAVCTKQKNEIGLCDMSGNVWEWTADWYGNYQSGSQQNPKGASSGSIRVLRGGSLHYWPQGLLSSVRNGYLPHFSHDGLGFRCVQASR